jgi:FkbM family methyltransferase
VLKTLIQQALRLFGVRLIRFRAEAEVGDVLAIGPFKLVTDNEELIRSYRDYPLNNSVIARIVTLLARENAALSMIDVGANCGDSAAIAQTAQDLPILCIEPDAHIFGILERNAVQFTKVDILRQYLGESAGSRGFAVTKTGWNNTLVTAGDENAAMLEFKTLDQVAAAWPPLNQLRFIKCDTEGFDVRVLHGAGEILSKQRPVLLLEYNREGMAASGEDGFRVFNFLESLGYTTVLLYDAFGRFLAAADLSQHELLRDFHDYADALLGKVLYYDVMVFHGDDATLAKEFIQSERTFRCARSTQS